MRNDSVTAIPGNSKVFAGSVSIVIRFPGEIILRGQHFLMGNQRKGLLFYVYVIL